MKYARPSKRWLAEDRGIEMDLKEAQQECIQIHRHASAKHVLLVREHTIYSCV